MQVYSKSFFCSPHTWHVWYPNDHVSSSAGYRLDPATVNLSPKMQPRLFCECIWVKPWCNSTITMKDALLRLTVFSFSAQIHFQWECYRHFYASLKISIFKTIRRFDTIWHFAHSISRVSAHEHQHWEHCFCTQSLLKITHVSSSFFL